MNFIKKVWDGKIDEAVHLQFQKFSRGEFPNRALVKVKKVKDKYTITTTNEFANDFVRMTAEKLGSNKTSVTGAIVSTANLKEGPFFHKLLAQAKTKQFMGIRQYIIDEELSGNEIIEMINKFPKGFFALTFNAGENTLKIKPKAPKSAKPSTKGDDKIKPDFCKLITNDSAIGKSFVWEKQDFKDAEISHTFIIEELVLPQGEKDFAKMRELAKRKGKILRKSKIDGEEEKTEKEFLA